MPFCATCNRALALDAASGAAVFRCACGAAVAGAPADARVGGAVLGAGETEGMYHNLIRTAAFDPTNQRVARWCPACGLDYVVQIRIGESETVVYKCKCGREERGGGRAAAA
jgi:predicted RNA-binding Zn-ribbon protein involved in translation (DUF1610 family)